MNWEPLASSNLQACRYDPASRVLQIRFHSGRSYDYADVPEEVYEGLKQADSPGGYFNGNIKDVYSAS